LVDLTDVILTEGRRSEYTAELAIDSLSYEAEGVFPIVEKTPVTLTVENKGGRKIELSVQTMPSVMIPCARCLKPVCCRLEIQSSYETELDDNEYIDGYNLDVDQLVHDEALLVWPKRVLCREDCKGLCDICGHDLNAGPCGCDHTEADPRMAKILDIFNKFKEV
jgi:uncharacterized protein